MGDIFVEMMKVQAVFRAGMISEMKQVKGDSYLHFSLSSRDKTFRKLTKVSTGTRCTCRENKDACLWSRKSFLHHGYLIALGNTISYQ